MVLAAGQKNGFRGLCIREVQKSLEQSAKRLIEDKIREMGLSSQFEPLRAETRCPGGGVISYVGMQDQNAESVKSYEGYDVAWVEEAQTLSARSLEMLRPTIRKPGSELWFTWNPRNATDPVDAFFRGQNPPKDLIIRRVNFDDNPFFPAELEAERDLDREARPDRYAHIWLGEYEPRAVGAIWDRQTIAENRRSEPPSIERIVIAVDPAVTNNTNSDEHGIIVCAKGEDGRGYVLEDASMKGAPLDWANRAVTMFDKWEADQVVIEVNQGGDMVKQTLKTVRNNLPIREVRATRGKHVRAEPISALYKLGRISHIGTMEELESQMCMVTAAGYEGEGSPDRVDALVWGFTELFDSINRNKKRALPQPSAAHYV